MLQFPFYKQPDKMDCGPTCIQMISKHLIQKLWGCATATTVRNNIY